MCSLSWLFKDCFFLFFFFFLFSLFGERAVFVWILDVGAWGFCVAGERRIGGGNGFLLQNNVVLSRFPCSEVSVLSLWTVRDETSLMGGRDEASCFFCKKALLLCSFFLAMAFRGSFFFSFFCFFLFGVRAVFVLGSWVLGLACCGRKKGCVQETGFFGIGGCGFV